MGMPPAPVAPGAPGATNVLARLPLQIGTTATWSAGRAAVALFPGLAVMGSAVALGIADLSDLGDSFKLLLLLLVIGGLLVFYALMHMRGAVRNRASDVLLTPEGLQVDGGRLHGERIPWNELTAPFADLQEETVSRLTLGTIFLILLSIVAESDMTGSSPGQVKVWRMRVHWRGQLRILAETDRPIERDSMAAAVASVSAVVSGQRYVAEAPSVAANIVSCGRCGGPAVPDDAPAVPCAYCQAPVPMPPEARSQAAATKMASQGRSATSSIVAKLRAQPRAGHANAWLFLVSLLMFGAWPLGWGLIAFSILADGFQWTDLLFFLLPFAAVLAGFFFARGRLADRGALQLLTLGFGALAPRREGEPARCRRCQGPLPAAGLGGVSQCRYCGAENIVGLDLRPSVDQARAEQHTFDDALKKRAREKILWSLLTGVSIVALLGWAVGTGAYVMSLVPEKTASAGTPPSPPTVSAPAPASPSPPPPSATHPAPAPRPSPSPTPPHKGH